MQMSLEAYHTNFNPPDLHVAKVLSFPGFPTLLCSVSKGKDEKVQKGTGTLFRWLDRIITEREKSWYSYLTTLAFEYES